MTRKLIWAAWAAIVAGTALEVTGLALAAPPASPVVPSAKPETAIVNPEDSSVVRRLKAALGESEAKLGELEPWQKKIFEEEAVPQYQRFIRNYRSGQMHSGTAVSSLEVDIDMESLKNYLRFYGPKTLGRDEKSSTVLLYLRADESCEKCVAAGPAIRKLVQARVERRGLVPVWLSAEDLGAGADGTDLSGKALDEKISELAGARGAPVLLVMQWGPAPADDVDTAHADEKHYLLHSLLRARGLAGTGKLAASVQSIARAEGKVDLLEVDSFDVSAGRLLSDAFVEIGAQALQAELAVAAKGGVTGDDSEIDVDVVGIRDFAQLGRLKAQIQTKLTAASIEERKISRGRVVIALVGEKAAPEVVRAQLAGLALDPASAAGGKLVPLDSSGPMPASTPEPGTGGSGGGDAPPTIAMEVRL